MSASMLFQQFQGRITVAVVAILAVVGVVSPEPYKISVVSLVAAICLTVDLIVTRTRLSGLLVVVFIGLAALAWPRGADRVVHASSTALHPEGAREVGSVASPSTNAAIRSRVDQAADRYMARPSQP